MISIISIGIRSTFEINGISGYEAGNDSLRGICCSIRYRWGRIVKAKFSTIIFNGDVSNEMGRYPGNLYRSIKRHKLGDIVQTKSKINPNSRNNIRIYIWTVDKKALSKWFKRNRHKNEEDNE